MAFSLIRQSDPTLFLKAILALERIYDPLKLPRILYGFAGHKLDRHIKLKEYQVM